MTDAIIFMCDVSGHAAEPWAEAGWDCYCIDIQHSIRRDRVVQHGAGRITFAWGDVRSWSPPAGVRPVFGVAMTPCTHVAGSGARDFRKKAGYFLRDSLEYYESARHGFEWAGIPYMMENSVGVLSSIPHIGKPDHYFDPSDYTRWCAEDNYTKKTCIWAGNGFVMPSEAKDETLGPPDNRIHFASPGDDRADFRSASPRGFFRAMHAVNDPRLAQRVAA
ncbi:hypothetical protein [Tardiphaga sp. 841_E9_N1_2]|uniref:hypothetical protein n=1 Tax=Tardiphaga sp. 841_E9_N1_2 TaxID=3240762 RepID=UPI003F23B7EF